MIVAGVLVIMKIMPSLSFPPTWDLSRARYYTLEHHIDLPVLLQVSYFPYNIMRLPFLPATIKK